MSLYNLHPDRSGLRITKFDTDLNPESSYLVSEAGCECPAGHRSTCRHRQMLPILLPRLGTSWFYNFDAKRWEDPMGAYVGQDEDGSPDVSAAFAMAVTPPHSSTAEQQTLTPQVAGSSPAGAATLGIRRRV